MTRTLRILLDIHEILKNEIGESATPEIKERVPYLLKINPATDRTYDKDCDERRLSKVYDCNEAIEVIDDYRKSLEVWRIEILELFELYPRKLKKLVPLKYITQGLFPLIYQQYDENGNVTATKSTQYFGKGDIPTYDSEVYYKYVALYTMANTEIPKAEVYRTHIEEFNLKIIGVTEDTLKAGVNRVRNKRIQKKLYDYLKNSDSWEQLNKLVDAYDKGSIKSLLEDIRLKEQ